MALLTSPYFWLLSSSYMVVFGAKSALSDWGQLVLIQEKGHSLITGTPHSFTCMVSNSKKVNTLNKWGKCAAWTARR